MNAIPAVLGSGMEPPPSDTQALEVPATAHWRQWLRKTIPRRSGVEDPRYLAGRVCFRSSDVAGQGPTVHPIATTWQPDAR